MNAEDVFLLFLKKNIVNGGFLLIYVLMIKKSRIVIQAYGLAATGFRH
jgi:hypothetical protein